MRSKKTKKTKAKRSMTALATSANKTLRRKKRAVKKIA